MNSFLLTPDEDFHAQFASDCNRLLTGAGFLPEHAERVAAVFVNADQNKTSDRFQDDTLSFLEYFSKCAKDYPQNQNILFVLLVSECLKLGPGGHAYDTPPGVTDQILRLGKDAGIDFGMGLVDSAKAHVSNNINKTYDFRKLAEHLLASDAIHFATILDPKPLVERAKSEQQFSLDILYPSKLGFWLDLAVENKDGLFGLHPYQPRQPMVEKILQGFYNQVFAKVKGEETGLLALGMSAEIDEWLQIKFGYRFDRMEEEWGWLSIAMEPFFDHLSSSEEPAPLSALERSYFQLAWRSKWFRARVGKSENAVTVLERCNRFFGRFRQLRRNGDTTTDTTTIKQAFAIGQEVVNCMLSLGSVLPCLKHLLQCLRNAAVPTVARDLRYWPEPNHEDQPPLPWSLIPLWIASILHNYLRDLLEENPELRLVRIELAVYCLERLKTKKTVPKDKESLVDEDFVEPSPVWRNAYVEALRALRVSPYGKAHHVLHFVKNSDPDTAVRHAAKTAYKELRHDIQLPEGMSPKTPLFVAVWWLRQAHFVSLMGTDKLDKQGAQRTYHKEVRRTKEKA